MEPRDPQVRYASLSGIVEITDGTGLDIAELFTRSGLDVAGLSQPDRWISATAVVDLLEDAAARSGYEDLGMRLAQERRLPNLGPLSLVIREEPHLRGALRTLIRYNHMYNEALHTRLVETGETTAIRLELNLGEDRPRRQSIELAVGTLAGILADLAGPAWRPLAICFSGQRPSDISKYHHMFGTNISFGEQFDGIVMRSADLDIANTSADPLLLPYAQQLLSPAREGRDAAVVTRTREVIESLLPAGRCSIDHVARNLGTNRRTLHRRLQRAGTTFTELLDTTRVDLVQRILSNPGNSLTDISIMLMFSTPGNFTRWFRQRFGVTPRDWRR